jgi:PAS domain S-box-containing protein
MSSEDPSEARSRPSAFRRLGRGLDRALPLGVKVAVPGLIIVIAVSSWMGARLVTDARANFRSAYAAAADHFAYMAQTQFEEAPTDREGMVEFLGELQEYTPDLAWIRLYLADGQALWASSEQHVEEEEPEAHEEHSAAQRPAGEVLTWSYPLEDGGRTVGLIRVGIETGAEGAGLEQARRDVASALAIAFLVGALALGTLLYVVILRRAARISRAAMQAAGGDMTVRLPEGEESESRDLLFNIARQFDRTLRTVDLRTRQQAAVASLGQRALAGGDLHELMNEAARLVAEGLEVELGSVMERVPEGFVLRAGFGWRHGAIGIRIPSDGQAGYTVQTGLAVISEDLSTEGRFRPPPILVEHGARSGATVIIPGPEEAYGVLGAHATRPRGFTAQDVHFLSSLAAVLGAAMHRRRARQQLAAAEARYRSLVEHVPAITYTAGFGSSGVWEYVSPQLEEVLGYRPDEWMADPQMWFRAIHPDDRAKVLDEEELSRRVDGHLASDYRMRTKDGRWRWIRDDAVVVRDEDGQAMFFQGVLYDITDQKEAEEALRRAYDREREAVSRLQALDEMKNAFLSAVSHELRTPLAAVLGYAVTLQQQDINLEQGERQEVIDRLTVNARKLHRLLEDLLDLDRLSRGIVDPHRQEVDVAALALRAVEEVDLADRAIDADFNPTVARVDGPKVERILENLLANAGKHSPPGTPIRVVVRPEDGGVLIAVEDRGPGVPDELKEDVFRPFIRGPERPAHSPGAGIGLSLVARFAELHGGRAWVEDRPGGGASFRVFLPDRAPASREVPEGARVGN